MPKDTKKHKTQKQKKNNQPENISCKKIITNNTKH